LTDGSRGIHSTDGICAESRLTGAGFHFSVEITFIRSYLTPVKIIIEKHPDGYVAYPAGIQGVVVGEGDTFDEALHDVQSAIRFHIQTFGLESLELENPAVDAFVAEAVV
jgi:predicted RNase H-like HicB family nuclease